LYFVKENLSRGPPTRLSGLAVRSGFPPRRPDRADAALLKPARRVYAARL